MKVKNKVGLVLEGGGLRGLFTAGVLDFFLDKGIEIPYLVGVSAGACMGASYVSRQKGRNSRVNIGFINDKRYISFRNLFKYKSLFGYDFMFNDIPYQLVPFDFDEFYRRKVSYNIGITNCKSGKAEYIDVSRKSDKEFMDILKASSSIPFISPMVNYNDQQYLDGGISDSIPVKKSIEDGNKKNIIVLTRLESYRKTVKKPSRIPGLFYKKYPELAKAINNRPKEYNETLDFIKQLEERGEVFVIRPESTFGVGRTERDKGKLTLLYQHGYEVAKNFCDKLLNWLE